MADDNRQDHRPLPAAQIDATRTQIVQILGDSFAADRLSLEELESRLERAYKARTVTDLRALVDDLGPAAEQAAPSDATAVARRDALPQAAESKTLLAVMGGVVRRGMWAVPRTVNVVAIMGGVELDLREAQLAPGVTEISVFALMGGVVIKVPPNVRLEVDGAAIMGGFEDTVYTPPVPDPAAPIVKVTGIAIMGGVEAKVKALRKREGAGEEDQ